MTVDVGNRQLYRNIFINIAAFIVQFVLSLYIAPVIVNKVGASAYGFIGLANDFITYASVITTIFNSVASRFIANAYYKNNIDMANRYFNSLIVANAVLSVIFAVLGVIVVVNVGRIFNVPIELMFDVQLTFSLVFGSYCISLLTMVFSTSTFVANRTDIQGFRNIINNIIKFASTVILLSFISIKIYWVSVAAMVGTIVVGIWNIALTKKLIPEVKINIKYAKKQYAVELAKSGVWMAFTSMSAILMNGLDLIIANKMLGANEMGLMSIARSMPNNIGSIINTIAPVFTPTLLMYYSRNKIEDVVCKTKESIKTMSVLLFVPIAGFLVYSYDFYRLWQSSLPDTDLLIVTAVSNITIIQAFFNASTATMAQLSVVTNKLKLPVFVSFVCGILNIIIVLIILKTTNIGIYGIAIPGTIIMILRYILFNSWYAAHVLGINIRSFILQEMRIWISIPFLCLLIYCVHQLILVTSWITLCVSIAIAGCVGYGFMILVYYRSQLKSILFKIKSKKR